MYAQLEERYQARDSFVHKLDPRTKLIVALGLIVAISLLPFGRWGIYALIWVVILFVTWAAKLEVGRLLKSSFVAIPFALAALALPFTVPGQVVAYLPVLHWPITYEGLERAASIFIKSWLSVQIAILLVMTTPLPALLWSLRTLRVPGVLVSIISFMYRYLFVLIDEAGRLLRARASRSAARVGQRAGQTLLWRGRVAGFMVGSLMLRSFERSERIYHAMAARGYAGELKEIETHHLAAKDIWVISGATLFVAMVLLVGK